MTVLEVLAQTIVAGLVGLACVFVLCGAFAAWETIQSHRRRLRILRHVIRADARMLATGFRLAMEHYRAANELIKRGEEQ